MKKYTSLKLPKRIKKVSKVVCLQLLEKKLQENADKLAKFQNDPKRKMCNLEKTKINVFKILIKQEEA